MLDIADFIVEKGGDPEKIRESQRRRFDPVEAVDEVIALYEDHRKTQYSATQINTKINDVQKQIGAKKKAKQDADDLLKEKADLEKEKKAFVESAAEKEKALNRKLKSIGNIVHLDVKVSANEDENEIIRFWPEDAKSRESQNTNIMPHHEVLLRLDAYDPERGVKVAGHRAYFLRGVGYYLNRALQNYGADFLAQKGYIQLQTPQFMNKDYMAKTAQLEQFDEELYKVIDGENDKYLIATSEQPLSAYHADEWLQPKDLPIKYAGVSTCYRKEAGSHGKDAWGIFRVHQFEKIEQFLLTDPEKSWEAFEEMVSLSEEFYKSLGVPYRVVEIVSGAFNNSAAKKYDVEAWFPYTKEYKELVSCSNCTDYQSRELNIRFGAKLQTETRKKYVHLLNCTLCATERTLCCLVENFQTEDGFVVPKPLRKYLLNEEEFFPFTKELPKDSTSLKAKGKVEKVAEKVKDLKV